MITEYDRYAEQCRRMATTTNAVHKQQLKEMAEAWTKLATAWRKQLDVVPSEKLSRGAFSWRRNPGTFPASRRTSGVGR
jgi:hypothetical protein